MEPMEDLPILSGEQWLESVDHEEAGETITPPIYGMLPFMRGTVTVLGAQTAIGKTAIGLQSFKWVTEQGFKCNYSTLEMSPPLLYKRFADQFDSEEEARDWIKYNRPSVSRSYLEMHELEAIIQSGFDFVVIDHIHELPFDGHEDLARKVKRLAALAPETNTAILMLSQMKQQDPTFGISEPTMYDYSWTKAIPEVAAVAYSLWKPDGTSALELRCLKNRFGALPAPIDLELDIKTVSFRRVR